MIALIVRFRVYLTKVHSFLILVSFLKFICVNFKCYRFISMSKNLEISIMSLVFEITKTGLAFADVFLCYLRVCTSMCSIHFAKANKHDYGTNR